MLTKLKTSMKSMRDVTGAAAGAAAEKAKEKAVIAKAKWNEINEAPTILPQSWEEHKDENGKPYYIDTSTGEWYRVKSKMHQRIDTNTKISMIEQLSKKQHEETIKEMADQENIEKANNNNNNNDNDKTEAIDGGGDNGSASPTDNGYINGTASKNRVNKSKHRSSTSLSKGWQCSKCTLENVGSSSHCGACMAPRPYVPSDEDDGDMLAMEESRNSKNYKIKAPRDELESKAETLSADDDFVKVTNPTKSKESNNNNMNGNTNGSLKVSKPTDKPIGAGHRPMNTFDAINAAVDASLAALGNIEIDGLSSEEKSALVNFMDFTDAEPAYALKFLRQANWDANTAMNDYFQANPDHPKSRQSSLQFDPVMVQQINNPIPDHRDILNDILDESNAQTGRRGSKELEYDNIKNNLDDDSDSDRNMPYSNNFNANNGVGVGGDDSLLSSEQASHNRMNTDQQIQIATHISSAQKDFDDELDTYRKEIESLKEELSEEKKKNEQLTKEKQQYHDQFIEITQDWDRMSVYMAQILQEVNVNETPALNSIITEMQNISRNYLHGNMGMDVNGAKSDIYDNVADLFSAHEPPSSNDNEVDDVGAQYDDDDDLDNGYRQMNDDMDEDEYEEDDGVNNNITTIQVEQYGSDAPARTVVNQHGRFDSDMSGVSPAEKDHKRGASFTIRDILAGHASGHEAQDSRQNIDGNESDSDDREPSVHSLPEEDGDDYFAISAYYGIDEDEDGPTGWDSRRSSMFGDYGRIHSRRESHRLTAEAKDIQKQFGITLADKLQDMKANNIKAIQELSEDDSEDDLDNGFRGPPVSQSQVGVVNDLFGGDIGMNGSNNNRHQKDPSYNGVKDLFGQEASDDDADDEDDDDLDMRIDRRKIMLARPSSAAALGATFDLISKQLKIQQPQTMNDDDDDDDEEAPDNSQLRVSQKTEATPMPDDFKPNLPMVSEEDKKQRIERRKKEKAEIRQEVEREMEGEFEEKLVRMKQEISDNLRESLTEHIRSDVESKMTEEFNRELDSKMSDKVAELKSDFGGEMDGFKNEMEKRETELKTEMERIQNSKLQFIKNTADEINSLRQIIRDHFHHFHRNNDNQNNDTNNQNNLNGMLQRFLKWG